MDPHLVRPFEQNFEGKLTIYLIFIGGQTQTWVFWLRSKNVTIGRIQMDQKDTKDVLSFEIFEKKIFSKVVLRVNEIRCKKNPKLIRGA